MAKINWLGTFVFVLSCPAWAAPTVFTAQKSTSHGQEEASVYFEFKKGAESIRVTKNTNLFELAAKAPKQATLGLFELPLSSPGAKFIFNQAKLLSRRIPAKPASGSASTLPHRLRILVDSKEIESIVLGTEQIYSVIQQTVKNPHLKPIHAAQVDLKEKSQASIQILGKPAEAKPPTTPSQTLCQSSGESRVHCEIPNWGGAYLSNSID